MSEITDRNRITCK